MLQGEVEHLRHVLRIARRHHDQVRKDPHVDEVEHAVMRRPVGSGQAGTIQREHDRQILQRHFLKDLIVSPLQKRAVDIDDRPQPGLGHAGRKGHRVRFADARVEEAVGKLVADRLQHVPLAHRGRQHRHLRSRAHLLANRVAHRQRVRTRRCRSGFGIGLAIILHEDRRRVEVTGIFGRRLEAVPLLGDHVQQDGSVQILDHLQVLAQQADVVPVDRPEVAEAQVLEQHAAVQPGLDPFLRSAPGIVRPDRPAPASCSGPGRLRS